ncbi:hypothetical protein ALC57_11459 [Trachymyrmex cornetzi]|uniref:Uncharacterized protein n=1 Tax=Trachymyrmex cornetzi TaxID=471704 RepID=A0A195DTP4_9HYME|nr:hypothetical protein ALC57_11459 [Trachymyrmex cornetzi]
MDSRAVATNVNTIKTSSAARVSMTIVASIAGRSLRDGRTGKQQTNGVTANGYYVFGLCQLEHLEARPHQVGSLHRPLCGSRQKLILDLQRVAGSAAGLSNLPPKRSRAIIIPEQMTRPLLEPPPATRPTAAATSSTLRSL